MSTAADKLFSTTELSRNSAFNKPIVPYTFLIFSVFDVLKFFAIIILSSEAT